MVAKQFKIQHFLLLWLILNVIQAAFMEMHVDEAYYWVYSRFLDWGYYDHPPMVAVFIKLGTWLSHSEFGTRMISVITNTVSLYLLWKIVEPYAKNPWLFSWLYFSFVIFHVFGFIVTPDSPLLFFSVLYLYFLSNYIKQERLEWTTVLVLAVAAAGMMYSKYHGILLLFFSIIAHWQLLKRPSFWLIVLLAVAMYLPHLWWQYQNDYPSVQYHILERTNRLYKLSYTTDFLLSILLVTGPLTSWYLFYRFYKQRIQGDHFLRILRVSFWGIMLFFLFASSKNNVQAQWVLLAYLPLFILTYIALAQLANIPKWFYTLLYITAGLMICVRLAVIIPIPALQNIKFVNAYWGHEELAHNIAQYAADRPVLFENGFQKPSSYNFYNNRLDGFAYDSRDYRKTQYDYWPIEDSIRHKDVYLVRNHSFENEAQDTIPTRLKGTWFGMQIDSLRTYQKVNITCHNLPDTLVQGRTYQLALTIHNPYEDEITFSNDGQRWPLYFEYGFVQYMWTAGRYYGIKNDYQSIKIPAKSSINYEITLLTPDDVLGEWSFFLSLRTDPFQGSRNSIKYSIFIDKEV